MKKILLFNVCSIIMITSLFSQAMFVDEGNAYGFAGFYQSDEVEGGKSTTIAGMGSYLFYVQHNFPDATFESKEGWTYIGAAFNSTSFLKMSRIMHWVTANIGYHHIHHVNARIPFYRLPETYKAFAEFQTPKTTSMRLGDVMRCFRLKVWDPELNRMLTKQEIQNYSAII